jgi:hypothetical protein
VPCCLLVLILLSPRLVLALLFFFSRYLTGPYSHNLLLLILGFVFLPLTTLVYAWMFHQGMPVEGINVLWLLVAALLDMGMVGGGYRHHRSKS